MAGLRIALLPGAAPASQEVASELARHHSPCDPEEADVLVPIGGDGQVLYCFHHYLELGKPVYGINTGSLGFLLNPRTAGDLEEKISKARPADLRPLRMRAVDREGRVLEALALNEASLFRQEYQAAKLGISVDGKKRLPELVCDGILLATPAGSTAYNFSAHGPILPLGTNLLALTPISPFRPRRWRGALLPAGSVVSFQVLDAGQRPVAAVADQQGMRDVVEVTVSEAENTVFRLLFDPTNDLGERILTEQFYS